MTKYLFSVIAKWFLPLMLFCSIDFTQLEGENAIKEYITFGLIALSCVLVFLYFNQLSKALKILTTLILLMFVALVVKSYTDYNVPFIYPHVFRKLILPLFVCAGYILVQKTGGYNIKAMVRWIYFMLFVKAILSIVTNGTLAFTWGEEGSRLLHAGEASMLLIPMIYHLISYCEGKAKINFVMFDLLLLFVSQHRTVWVAATVALVLMAIKYPVLIKRTVPVAIILFFLSIFILSQDIVSEQFQNRLSTQIEDIFNYKEQGTGAWRYEQSQFFMAKIIEKPAFGWDFQAFEAGDVMNVETFDEKGTHIHSAYVDAMYYFGVLGLLISLGSFLLLATRYFKTHNLGLLFPIFAAGILAYGLAYQLAPYSLFICGIGLALAGNPQKPFFSGKQSKTIFRTSL